MFLKVNPTQQNTLSTSIELKLNDKTYKLSVFLPFKKYYKDKKFIDENMLMFEVDSYYKAEHKYLHIAIDDVDITDYVYSKRKSKTKKIYEILFLNICTVSEIDLKNVIFHNIDEIYTVLSNTVNDLSRYFIEECNCEYDLDGLKRTIF